jgi:hypothetical protein
MIMESVAGSSWNGWPDGHGIGGRIGAEYADVMPGTGGFRKVRWQDTRRGKGKRGGLRVIYNYLSANHQVWFFTLYNFLDKLCALFRTSQRFLVGSM